MSGKQAFYNWFNEYYNVSSWFRSFVSTSYCKMLTCSSPSTIASYVPTRWRIHVTLYLISRITCAIPVYQQTLQTNEWDTLLTLIRSKGEEVLILTIFDVVRYQSTRPITRPISDRYLGWYISHDQSYRITTSTSPLFGRQLFNIWPLWLNVRLAGNMAAMQSTQNKRGQTGLE